MTSPEIPAYEYPTLRTALEGVAGGHIYGVTIYTEDGSPQYSFCEVGGPLAELSERDLVYPMSANVAREILEELSEDLDKDLDRPPDSKGLSL